RYISYTFLIQSFDGLPGFDARGNMVRCSRQAVQWQASSIIVAHNHPSGDPAPSRKDIELTKELLAASKVLHIPLLDHLVIGSPDSGTGFISLRTDGFMKFEG
ncbi:MAG: hypothetical protein II180_04640, partial [Proteobacteria bacterium]|nr:hypothetical protein [Pseudomonadota bacterium]